MSAILEFDNTTLLSPEDVRREVVRLLRNGPDTIGYSELIRSIVEGLAEDWETTQSMLRGDPYAATEALRELRPHVERLLAVGFPAVEYPEARVLDRVLKATSRLLLLSYGRSGHGDVLSMPSVLAHDVFYCLGGFGMECGNVQAVSSLLDHRFLCRPSQGERAHLRAFEIHDLFHSELFDGSAARTFDHLLETCGASGFVCSAFEMGKEGLTDRVCQLNFIVCLKLVALAESGQTPPLFYANFGRFYARRLYSLFVQLTDDDEFARALCFALFDETPEQFRSRIPGRYAKIRRMFWGEGGYEWEAHLEVLPA